jgi:hypothetical protein
MWIAVVMMQANTALLVDCDRDVEDLQLRRSGNRDATPNHRAFGWCFVLVLRRVPGVTRRALICTRCLWLAHTLTVCETTETAGQQQKKNNDPHSH